MHIGNNILVGQHYALGLACGAGGVDDAGEIIRVD